MAKYSHSAVHPVEVKRIKKTLDTLDSKIALPDSLRGQALLHKLDGVEPEIPVGRKVRELLLPRRRSMRTLATYAAAFVLMVGLVYTLGLGRTADLAQGEVVLGTSQVIESPPLGHGGGVSPPSPPVGYLVEEWDVPVTSTLLGEMGEYTLIHMSGERGNALLLMCAEGQAVSLVELEHEMEITSFYTQGYLLTLIGVNGESIYTYTIDFTDAVNPSTSLVVG